MYKPSLLSPPMMRTTTLMTPCAWQLSMSEQLPNNMSATSPPTWQRPADTSSCQHLGDQRRMSMDSPLWQEVVQAWRIDQLKNVLRTASGRREQAEQSLQPVQVPLLTLTYPPTWETSPATMTPWCSAPAATTPLTIANVIPSPFDFEMGLAGESIVAPAAMKKTMKKPMLKKRKSWPRRNPWVMDCRGWQWRRSTTTLQQVEFSHLDEVIHSTSHIINHTGLRPELGAQLHAHCHPSSRALGPGQVHMSATNWQSRSLWYHGPRRNHLPWGDTCQSGTWYGASSWVHPWWSLVPVHWLLGQAAGGQCAWMLGGYLPCGRGALIPCSHGSRWQAWGLHQAAGGWLVRPHWLSPILSTTPQQGTWGA